MRIAPPSRLMMMARTDKEARLKDFIDEGLAYRAEELVRHQSITIVVRNSESPLARAICAAMSEDSRRNVSLRVIFGETHVEDQSGASLFDIAGAEFRVLADPRFGAAHEQLVIGNSHTWIGDCLRRDPAKRDAFELYHPAGAPVCIMTSASFEKLWGAAKPMKTPKAGTMAPEIIAAGQTDGPDAMPRNHRH